MAEQNIFSGADQIVAVAEKYFLMNREDVLNVIYNKLRTMEGNNHPQIQDNN